MPRVQLAWEAADIAAAESPSLTMPYVVKDVVNEEQALAALLASNPSEYVTIAGNSLFLQTARINKRIGPTIWGGQVVYGPKPTGEQLTGKVRFTTTGGTAKIQAALAQRRYPAGAPDHKGAIGVTKDSIEGIEVQVPALGFDRTIAVLAANITDDWIKAVARMTPSTNNGPWKGFDAGEVLFKGLDGDVEEGKKWANLVYHFAASENAVNLDVGLANNQKVEIKKGWEFLELVGNPKADANELVCQPTAAYVSQVYRSANFLLLGLGS